MPGQAEAERQALERQALEGQALNGQAEPQA
jgi:hypothetical protein